jgi:hypothetical protein
MIVFGSDETIAHFRALCRPEQTFLGYGHQLSIGVVFDDPNYASVAPAARDVAVFDQQGCLSPQVLYIRSGAGLDPREYASRMAAELERIEQIDSRRDLPPAGAARLRAFREELAFLQANGEPIELWESSRSTAWTVVFDSRPGFPVSPLDRTIFIKPLPEDLAPELAPVRRHLSTVGVWPLSPDHLETAAAAGASRICALGEMQRPPLTWLQDGRPVLSPLVRWISVEMPATAVS